MEALSGWTLALLRLLSALPGSWTWAPPYSSLAHSYLNAAQRPLWILEDELMRRHSRHEADYLTSTRATPLRRGRSRRRQDREQPLATAITIRVRSEEAEAEDAPPAPASTRSPRRFALPHRVQLPNHYVQQLSSPLLPSRSRPKSKAAQRRRQPQSLPIFDSVPGDNALPTASYPIFVYNGSRGELLLNTMLSAQRYPMQEPVPGQVLYPPSTPMFRPKPIVERLRLPGQRQLLNLTLIPFYAHEAIPVPPLGTIPTTAPTASTSPATGTSTGTGTGTGTSATTAATTLLAGLAATVPATAAASAPPAGGDPPAVTTPMPTPYETQLPRSKRKRKSKKAKQYSAYRSPQEVVQWQPTERSSPALAPPDNHRHYMVATTDSTHRDKEQQLEQLEAELELTSQELQLEEQTESAAETQPEQEQSTAAGSSSSSSFQIVYVDESMEAPYDSLASTTAEPPTQLGPRQSSRYALRREYYAFPVYTLGKLLRSPQRLVDHRARKDSMDLDCSGSCPEQDDSTWFILNSRYRGPHRHGLGNDQVKYYTSKYVQNIPR